MDTFYRLRELKTRHLLPFSVSQLYELRKQRIIPEFTRFGPKLVGYTGRQVREIQARLMQPDTVTKQHRTRR